MATLTAITVDTVISTTLGSFDLVLTGDAPYIGTDDTSTSYIEQPNVALNGGIGSWELQDVDSDFSTMDTLSMNFSYAALSNLVDDLNYIDMWILTSDELTVLAGASSTLGSSHQRFKENEASTSWADLGATAFTYVNTTATKTQWNGARLFVEIWQDVVMSNDGARQYVSYVELTGTYTTTGGGGLFISTTNTRNPTRHYLVR
jgi:hypothetical protein